MVQPLAGVVMAASYKVRGTAPPSAGSPQPQQQVTAAPSESDDVAHIGRAVAAARSALYSLRQLQIAYPSLEVAKRLAPPLPTAAAAAPEPPSDAAAGSAVLPLASGGGVQQPGHCFFAGAAMLLPSLLQEADVADVMLVLELLQQALAHGGANSFMCYG